MNQQRSSQRNNRVALKLLIIGCAAAILPNCSSPTNGSDSYHVTSDTKDLMHMSRDWSRAAATGNVDAVVGYWADDAAVMVPGLPTFRGKAAIRQYIEQSLKTPGFRIKWKPVEARVSQSGDIGYLIERSSVTAPNAKGQLETHEYRAVTIWQKSPDGKWRNIVDASVPD
jgi:uncharacterized protein (TIGR02246 family)